MMEKDVSYNIGIKFQEFRFLRFGFIDNENCDNTSLGVQLSVALNEAELVTDGNAQVVINVTVLFVCDSTKEIVANIETVSLFGLEGISDVVAHAGGVKYPDTLLTTLVSIAISTTRGAILAKGAGSFLEKMPLPIVDPKGFVELVKAQEKLSGAAG